MKTSPEEFFACIKADLNYFNQTNATTQDVDDFIRDVKKHIRGWEE